MVYAVSIHNKSIEYYLSVCCVFTAIGTLNFCRQSVDICSNSDLSNSIMWS